MAFTSAAQEARLGFFLRGGDCGAGQATFLPDKGPPRRESNRIVED